MPPLTPAPPAAPGNNPLAALGRHTNTLAHQVADFVAGRALAAGYPGVADWAQRHVMPTFVGCAGLVATMAFAILAAGYGAIMSDAPAAPIVAQASAAVTVPVDPMALAPGETLHKIVRNDVLSTIARDEGVTVEALVARNAALLAQWQKDCEDTTTRDASTCLYTIRRGKQIVVPAGGQLPTSSAQ